MTRHFNTVVIANGLGSSQTRQYYVSHKRNEIDYDRYLGLVKTLAKVQNQIWTADKMKHAGGTRLAEKLLNVVGVQAR